MEFDCGGRPFRQDTFHPSASHRNPEGSRRDGNREPGTGLFPGVVSGTGSACGDGILTPLHALHDLGLLGFGLAGLSGLCGRHGCGSARDFRAATCQTRQKRGDGSREGEREAISSVHVESLCRGTGVCT